jgi:hypothetical protein
MSYTFLSSSTFQTFTNDFSFSPSPNCNLSCVDFFLLTLHFFSSLFHSITLNNQSLHNIESFYAKFANLKLNIHFKLYARIFLDKVCKFQMEYSLQTLCNKLVCLK